ncbi:MAG: DUF4430 domain-containing protein [Solirubrobacteraceae bacterium]
MSAGALLRAGTAIPAVLTAAALAGCGLGAGPGTSNASITVTRDFGARSVGALTQKHVPGAETVMQMLERGFAVATSYGGGFVQSIDSFAGSSAHRDWFYYVNGIEAPSGAATTAVHRGDHIWWDLHDWSATDSIPAVVGSFPEPFLDGIAGKRVPTIVDCAEDVDSACQTVSTLLRRVRVPVSGQALGGGSSTESLPLAVGTWSDLQGVVAAILMQRGPAASGIYARFVGVHDAALELLDPDGDVVRTLHGSVGLIAATEQASEDQPTWLITGTDVAGVDAAAAALTPARLHDHFALALAGGQSLPLPLMPSR